MAERTLLSCAALLLLVTFSVAQTGGKSADIVLVNGRVFTALDSTAYAEAIAIQGERIIAVGTNQEIDLLVGPKTRRIDVGGRLVIPGILDTHNHYFGAALPTVSNFDSGEWAPSCKRVLEQVAQKVKTIPKGNLLFGSMGPEAFFDPGCTPAVLDHIAPDTPVFLMSGTPHGGMLNRAAVKWFGIDITSPPPLGGYYGKDMRSKTWDGVVHHGAAIPLTMRTATDGSQDDERLRSYFLAQAKWGITSNTFLEYDPASRVEQLARVNATHRVRVVPFAQYETSRTRRRLQQVAVPANVSDRVTARGEKWCLDGSPIERQVGLRQPYADAPSSSGQVDYPETEVRAILEEALQHDLPLMVHAIGDRTIETLFNQMERTGGQEVWAKRRLRVEHGDGVMGDLIPRARKLGVIVAENPTHFVGDLAVKRLGPKRAAMWMPFKSLANARIPIVIASDGGPGDVDANPFLNIQLATTYPANPKEAITREQALVAYTRTAAYSQFEEERLGTLEPGKLADIAVLSQDILIAPVDQLPKTESVLTIVGGKIAYSRDPMP